MECNYNSNLDYIKEEIIPYITEYLYCDGIKDILSDIFDIDEDNINEYISDIKGEYYLKEELEEIEEDLIELKEEIKETDIYNSEEIKEMKNKIKDLENKKEELKKYIIYEEIEEDSKGCLKLEKLFETKIHELDEYELLNFFDKYLSDKIDTMFFDNAIEEISYGRGFIFNNGDVLFTADDHRSISVKCWDINNIVTFHISNNDLSIRINSKMSYSQFVILKNSIYVNEGKEWYIDFYKGNSIVYSVEGETDVYILEDKLTKIYNL